MRTIRVLPALSGAATVVLTGALVREFRGGRFAILLACLGVLINPLFLFMHHYYSMNALDIFLWTAALLLFTRMLRQPGENARRWILLGLVLGLGAMNKIGVLWLSAGIGLSLLLTRERVRLRSLWPWAGVATAVLLFVPYLLWQIRHDWPTVEFIRNASEWKYSRISRGDFLLAQIVELHPLAFPLWLFGALSLLFFRLRRPFRPLGLAWA